MSPRTLIYPGALVFILLGVVAGVCGRGIGRLGLGSCTLRGCGIIRRREEFDELLWIRLGHLPGFLQVLQDGHRIRTLSLKALYESGDSIHRLAATCPARRNDLI